MSSLYDPVCVTSFFNEVELYEYGINRAIDAKLSSFGFEDLRMLLKATGITRRARHERVARQIVAAAKDQWPALLQEAPRSVQTEVLRRLNGGVALARI